ncbi:hypothetical protein LCGC14_1536610 [marine sediment metagenome]|uniref:Uncharacterized protein n=1 Tax=marine sediment metagenome TaxID=412755 RepID=A0A0F9LA45_9ZZZZ
MYNMVKTSNNPKVFSKKCKVCGKVISSLIESQFKYNYEQHILKHDRDATRIQNETEVKK